MVLFTKSLKVTKLHCVRHRQVDFCAVNYEYFNNHSEVLMKDPSILRQSCSDGIARKLPGMATHKFRKLTQKN